MITKELLSAALSAQQDIDWILESEKQLIRASNQFDGNYLSTARKIVTLAAKESLEAKQNASPTQNKRIIKLAFILSMPGCPSWNGKWSGRDDFYAKIVPFSGKDKDSRAKKLTDERYFSYRWPDGWRASIEVKQVDDKEAREIKKKSNGFCGYDWMVTSILKDGYITTEQDEIENATNEINS